MTRCRGAVILSDFTVQRYPRREWVSTSIGFRVTEGGSDAMTNTSQPSYLYRVNTEWKTGIIILAPFIYSPPSFPATPSQLRRINLLPICRFPFDRRTSTIAWFFSRSKVGKARCNLSEGFSRILSAAIPTHVSWISFAKVGHFR